MPRRASRIAASLIPLALLVPLAACGSSSTEEKSSPAKSRGLDEVSFTGDVGKSVKAKWDTKVALPDSTKVTTLEKGDGDKIAKGDAVSTYLWVGNGTTKKEVFSYYDNGAPESLPNNGQLGTVFDQIFKDATYGSRVVAVTNSTDLFGSPTAGAQLGIGEKDGIVLVADLVKKAPVAPTPKDDKVHDAPASELPKVVVEKGKPVGFDWAGIEEPALTTPVQRVVLKKGKGAVVKATDTVTVNYFGMTYKGESPFDESFTKEPYTKPLNELVRGWSIGLPGVKVGSRVLLQMPPAFGYGAEGSAPAIPGNATLWFVIDVVKTTK